MKLPRENPVTKDIDPEQALYEAIAAIRNGAEAKQFFQDLCTPTEIQAMADRWLAVHLIKEGKPYRQIYDESGVSVTTIGRVARCILLGQGGYNLIYARVEKTKVEKNFHENSNTLKNRRTKKRPSE